MEPPVIKKHITIQCRHTYRRKTGKLMNTIAAIFNIVGLFAIYSDNYCTPT
ncbi:MAG: hypothetical protein GF363_09255 [Chitinivibrionales bacterium]|nr:hypothetical protein [Chitinivibrionales bacterium]